MPPWFAIAFGLAILAAFVPGTGGLIGRTLALIFAVPFFLQGLAVLHSFAGRTKSPGMMLAVVYVVLFIFGGLVALVTLLGLVEDWVRLRRRFAGTAGRPGG